MRLNTKTWGKTGGPIALLLHGVTNSSEAWWRLGPWLAEAGCFVLAPDLRGHGDSPRTARPPSLEDLARDVLETIDSMVRNSQVNLLLGHSLGSLVAMKLCEIKGELFERVVLYDPPGAESVDFVRLAEEIEAGGAAANEQPEMVAEGMRAANPWLPERRIQSLVENLARCDARPMSEMVRGLADMNIVGLGGSVRVPSLLLLGSEKQQVDRNGLTLVSMIETLDHRSSLMGTERTDFVKALPRPTIKTFETGHNIHEEDFGGFREALKAWM